MFNGDADESVLVKLACVWLFTAAMAAATGVAGVTMEDPETRERNLISNRIKISSSASLTHT